MERAEWEQVRADMERLMERKNQRIQERLSEIQKEYPELELEIGYNRCRCVDSLGNIVDYRKDNMTIIRNNRGEISEEPTSLFFEYADQCSMAIKMRNKGYKHDVYMVDAEGYTFIIVDDCCTSSLGVRVRWFDDETGESMNRNRRHRHVVKESKKGRFISIRGKRVYFEGGKKN